MTTQTSLARRSTEQPVYLPTLIAQADEKTARRFLEFFAATIRNRNTRQAYYRGVCKFLDWSAGRGVTDVTQVQPMLVAAFIEEETGRHEAQTVKQELAAIRMLFDYLVTGHIVEFNPATSVRGPKYSQKRGKTPVLTREEARRLLDSIRVEKDGQPDLKGLRDRALLAVMVYSFARVGAVLKMRVQDYYPSSKKWWLRLHEKGGKLHEVPVHHKAEAALDAYLEATGIAEDKKAPLFQTLLRRSGRLTGRPLAEPDVWRMVRARARAAGIATDINCHSFRATGITAYLENGGSVEHAQQIAAHESPRTTKLYDRRNDDISLEEVERIRL